MPAMVVPGGVVATWPPAILSRCRPVGKVGQYKSVPPGNKKGW